MPNKLASIVIACVGLLVGACAKGESNVDYLHFPDPKIDLKVEASAGPQTAVVAGGCFWCTEGVYQNTPGVTAVVSGYSGGSKETADYESVCTGTTNHAEAVQVTYDPTKTSYGQILKAFFSIAHDPTTLNRQGNDVGTQYRSAIFYTNEDQKRIAQAYIDQLNAAKVFSSPIVTTLEPLNGFYPAEKYHQNYAKLNPDQPYIMSTALPKIHKAQVAAEAAQRAPATTQTSQK